MTGTSSATSEPGGESVDRRWFEEALRSQGFVVEPPDGDTVPGMPEAVEAEAHTGEPASAVATAPADERPPVPSALLARIASRGQGPAAIAPSEPDASDVSVTSADGVTGTTAPEEAPQLRPWEVAVPAVVAPWSPAAEPVAAEPVAAEPVPVTGPVAAEPVAVVERPQVPAVTPPPKPVPLPAEPPIETAGTPTRSTAADTAVRLESPYAPAPTATEDTTAAPPPVQSVGPESDEGGLWALVGSSEPTTASVSTRSAAVRVTLTVLTALVIIVIVVGSLVLASQLV